MKQIKQETGRSMVEMLGVLAVIGVLSVGGIAAYKNAMNKHEANSIRNEVNRRVVVWASDNAFGRDFSPFNKNALGYQWQDPENKGDFIQFGVSGIEAEICEKVKSNDWKMVYVNENCTTFAFKNDLTRSEIQPTCGPCGVANPITGACNDDDSKCGSGETCYNGYCSTCEDGEFKTSKGACTSCNPSSLWVSNNPDECLRCKGIRFYTHNDDPSKARCTPCTAEGVSSKESCLTCPNTFYYNDKCYFCDSDYAILQPNRIGLDACVQENSCPTQQAFIAGRCRSCITEHVIGYTMTEDEAKNCLGVFSTKHQNYLFWDKGSSCLLMCNHSHVLSSTQEGCLVCNQPNSQYRRYFKDGQCFLCPNGEYAPNGTPCDELTTESTTAGIAPTP